MKSQNIYQPKINKIYAKKVKFEENKEESIPIQPPTKESSPIKSIL
jgi:hypothetical protein